MLNKGFYAWEKIWKNSYLLGPELTRSQTGYLRRNRRLHEQWLKEDQGSLMGFEQLAAQAKDDDKYDTKAEEESDRLEQALEREKASQVRWKKEHRWATEDREKRTVVSQRERSDEFRNLAKQLSYSEETSWKEQY